MKILFSFFVCLILAIISLAISILSFHEKGFLFNNAYVWASKVEREKMDKKPHYKQSGIIFLLIGIVFTVNSVNAILETNFLFFIVIAILLIAVIYAIVSSILIEKNKK